MRLSRSDFQAIKAKTAQKRAKRAGKVADNASLASILAQDAPGRALAAAVGLDPPKRAAGKPRPLSQKNQIKALKKRILGTGGLWSQAVRKRDGSRCVMCGSIQRVGAHHWLYRRSHSMALAVDPANGISLCAYPCHLGRVHHDGDGDFILQLAAKMTEIVGDAKIAEMRETAKHPQPLSLEFWQEAERKLKTFLQNRP